MFCSFALNFITDGVAYTFGIFFSELLHEFESSKAAGSWVPSIMTGLTFCVGELRPRFTIRTVRFQTLESGSKISATIGESRVNRLFWSHSSASLSFEIKSFIIIKVKNELNWSYCDANCESIILIVLPLQQARW